MKHRTTRNEEPSQEEIEHALEHQQAIGAGAERVAHLSEEERVKLKEQARERQRENWVHPMVLLARKYGENLKITSQVAAKFNVSTEAVRRYARSPAHPVPTYRVRIGARGKKMSLWTPEDISYLDEKLGGERRLERQDHPRTPERAS